MNIISKYQNIILVVVVLVIAFVVYSYFFTGKPAEVLTEETVSTASPADQDLISLLEELKSITLDESIFSNPAFMSLQDFSQELVQEPVGRTNPFAPLSSGAGSTAH